ncbi:globin [Gordonia sp. (in: high G+C Gram-positive bacteria)]|uniref:globin n=1 Tax=Gordonia sp. (in: high G+C Gram-positive bacteria) TaxID=84139 RepID=UPI0039E2412A
MAAPRPDDSAVARSLELYEDKLGNPTEAIYRRLYAVHPDAQEIFAGDTYIPKRMMAGIFETVIDLAEGTIDPAYTATWVPDHVAAEVSRPMIATMFDAVVDEIREGLGDDWDADMQADWDRVMATWQPVVWAKLDELGE